MSGIFDVGNDLWFWLGGSALGFDYGRNGIWQWVVLAIPCSFTLVSHLVVILGIILEVHRTDQSSCFSVLCSRFQIGNRSWTTYCFRRRGTYAKSRQQHTLNQSGQVHSKGTGQRSRGTEQYIRCKPCAYSRDIQKTAFPPEHKNMPVPRSESDLYISPTITTRVTRGKKAKKKASPSKFINPTLFMSNRR